MFELGSSKDGEVRSHNYRYQYWRKVVRKEDADEIISFLKSYNAEIYAREVILIQNDLKKLGLAE